VADVLTSQALAAATTREATRAHAGPPRAPEVQLPGWKSAAVGVLWTVGIVCVVPQGLVPIGFNLFGVDPLGRGWFAARYLPQQLQVPVAAGFIVAGTLAMWWAYSIGRGHAGRR
jgi:hypothetical protein